MESLEEGSFSLGPWGGTGGDSWSFVASRGIFGVTIQQEILEGGEGKFVVISFIDTERSVYGAFGSKEKSESTVQENILFDNSSGDLEFISGTYGTVAGYMGTVITSISFTTNIKTFGPYGIESGEVFSTSMDSTPNRIVGFHGRSSHSNVDSIGVYLMPINIEEEISVGQWGDVIEGKEVWNLRPTGSSVTNRIVILYGATNIKSISIGDACRNFVCNDPETSYDIKFEVDPSSQTLEFVKILNETLLLFPTNTDKSPQFGTNELDLSSNSEIIGFHGRGDKFLHLGFFIKPRISNEPISMGKWGGTGGVPWEFKADYGINEIFVRSSDVLDSLSFRDANGSISERFGALNPNKLPPRISIDIEWPSEYFTSISGTYGFLFKNKVITSISFSTNWRTFGPFGRGHGQGTPFSSNTKGSVIVGFHGRSGHNIDAIGIYVRPHKRVQQENPDISFQIA